MTLGQQVAELDAVERAGARLPALLPHVGFGSAASGEIARIGV